MLGNIGPMEIALVLIIALIVFGPKRVPELGRSLGKGIREFRSSLSGENEEDGPPSPQVPREIEGGKVEPVEAGKVEPVVHKRP